MKGKPFRVAGAVNHLEGETIKDCELSLPQDKLFIIEFVGINAFAQNGQDLFFALQVNEDSAVYTYPIAPTGSSPYLDPEYPARIFGSQQVRLYVGPGGKLIVTFARSGDNGDARAFFDISGRIITP